MKRKLLPPFLMLFAGAVSGLIMLRLNYDTRTMLEILLGVLFVFYLLGSGIKKMLDIFEKQNEHLEEDGEVIEKDVLPEEEDDVENTDTQEEEV